MDNKVNEIVTAIGALAETLRILRESLIKNGFTRAEAFELCRTYLSTTLRDANHKSSEE